MAALAVLCNWCHTPDVAKTKQKCAISTLIFRKFSGGIAPRPPYWGGATAPLPRSYPLGAPALRASAPRSGPSVPPSSCPLQKSWLRACPGSSSLVLIESAYAASCWLLVHCVSKKVHPFIFTITKSDVDQF